MHFSTEIVFSEDKTLGLCDLHRCPSYCAKLTCVTWGNLSLKLVSGTISFFEIGSLLESEINYKCDKIKTDN